MNDFRGKEIQKGDKVIYVQKGRYTSLMVGIVLGFTPRMVQIATSHGSDFSKVDASKLDTIVNPYNLVVVTD
jgi:hypothetical protein